MELFLVSVAGFESAQRGIQRKLDALTPRAFFSVLDRLDEADKCFSDNSRVFPDAVRRNRAREIATEYGRTLVKTHPLGHDGSEARACRA